MHLPPRIQYHIFLICTLLYSTNCSFIFYTLQADTDNKLSNPYDSNYDIFSKVPRPVSDVNANSDVRRTFKHNNMGKNLHDLNKYSSDWEKNIVDAYKNKVDLEKFHSVDDEITYESQKK